MRWSMLPVSILAHATAFALCLIVPLARDVEAPTPWPLSSAYKFVAAAPVSPPPRGETSVRRASLRNDAAPREAPDRISDSATSTPPIAVGDDLIAGDPSAETGVPEGLTVNAVTPPPVAIAVTPPAPPRIYRTGGAIREPRKIHDVPPAYPEIARAAHIEGTVILEATIDERGVVTDARVLRSVPLLDNAALTALRQWRYTPTLLNGVPVRVLMTVTFRFSLGDREL
jgi:periplasmic protein TonB